MSIFRSRLAEEIARNREFFARLNNETRDREHAMRQFIRRNELVMANLVSITDDLRDESHAQRQAVLRMIDKLDERLPPPDAAGAG